MGKRTGRKSKCTKELIEKISTLISAGNYVETACKIVGIGTTTYYEWLERARQGKQPYVDFAEEIEKAEALAEARRVQLITKAGETDWKAAAWYLERKYPEKFGRKEKVEHSGRIDGQQELTHRFDHLTDEEIEAELKKLEGN